MGGACFFGAVRLLRRNALETSGGDTGSSEKAWV
jgi:hypothetical protein